MLPASPRPGPWPLDGLASGCAASTRLGRSRGGGQAAALVGGPLVYLWGQMLLGREWFARWEPAQLGDPAGKIADDLLLTGAYPLVTWAAPLLVRLWLGRRDLAKAPARPRPCPVQRMPSQRNVPMKTHNVAKGAS